MASKAFGGIGERVGAGFGRVGIRVRGKGLFFLNGGRETYFRGLFLEMLLFFLGKGGAQKKKNPSAFLGRKWGPKEKICFYPVLGFFLEILGFRARTII